MSRYIHIPRLNIRLDSLFTCFNCKLQHKIIHIHILYSHEVIIMIVHENQEVIIAKLEPVIRRTVHVTVGSIYLPNTSKVSIGTFPTSLQVVLVHFVASPGQ